MQNWVYSQIHGHLAVLRISRSSARRYKMAHGHQMDLIRQKPWWTGLIKVYPAALQLFLGKPL